jgi:kinesin family protein 11
VSYSSLGKDFKNTFEGLSKRLVDQQTENQRLHQQILEANSALVSANAAAQSEIVDVIGEEKQKATEERQQLLAQITSLINSTAETQDRRLNERMMSVNEGIGAANGAYNTEQIAYSEGMDAWSTNFSDILAGVAKSRDTVKMKIKADFAVSTVPTMFETVLTSPFRPHSSIQHRSKRRRPLYTPALSIP